MISMEQHGVNSDVPLPNDYTHAKFEKVLPITSKEQKNINIILLFVSK